MDEFDVIVIGAGPAGENVAGRAARGGLSVAVVESGLAGGECSYWACIPSKALLRPVHLLDEANHVPGVPAGPLDPVAVLRRRDEAVSGYDDAGQIRWVEDLPATLVRGHARLDGARRVVVDGRTLTARHAVVIAVGSAAAIPDVPGMADANPWTNREATGVYRIPRRLLVLGGGVVACEMAQALDALGTQTTMLVRGERLLARAEPFAGQMVADALRGQGIGIRFRSSVRGVRRPQPGGPVTVELADGDLGGGRVEADELLVATGRRPRTSDLGLASVGLPEGGWLDVDDWMRVRGVPGGWLYAVGDANGRNLLTHMGKYQARACGDVIVARAGTGEHPGSHPAGGPDFRTGGAPDARAAAGQPDAGPGTAGPGTAGPGTAGPGTAASDSEAGNDSPGLRASADHLGPPQVVFTSPQVASVGLTEQAARARGHDVRTVEYDLGNVSGAYLFGDGYTGRAKAVIDVQRRVLLGVTFVGPGVAEMLHAATIAVVGQVPLERLWHAVPAFPTISEVWLRLLEGYGL